MSVVLPCCPGGALTLTSGCSERLEVLGERAGVDGTGDAQRAPEGAPALRQRETGGIGMQVRPPTLPPPSWIGHETVPDRTGLVTAVLDRDNPQQLGGRRADPAPYTGTHRGRATYHRESLPCAPPPDPTHARPHDQALGDTSVSGRMSIFQPVRRAANRAFCPSRPIASESW